MIWGVGPTLVLPTATNTSISGRENSAWGPALVQPSHFTMGYRGQQLLVCRRSRS